MEMMGMLLLIHGAMLVAIIIAVLAMRCYTLDAREAAGAAKRSYERIDTAREGMREHCRELRKLVGEHRLLLKIGAMRGRVLTPAAQERIGQELRDASFGISGANAEAIARIMAVADEIHPPEGVELPIIGEVESDDHD